MINKGLDDLISKSMNEGFVCGKTIKTAIKGILIIETKNIGELYAFGVEKEYKLVDINNEEKAKVIASVGFQPDCEFFNEEQARKECLEFLQEKLVAHINSSKQSLGNEQEIFNKLCNDSNYLETEQLLDEALAKGYDLNKYVHLITKDYPITESLPVFMMQAKKFDGIEKLANEYGLNLSIRQSNGDTLLDMAIKDKAFGLVECLAENRAINEVFLNMAYNQKYNLSKEEAENVVSVLVPHRAMWHLATNKPLDNEIGVPLSIALTNGNKVMTEIFVKNITKLDEVTIKTMQSLKEVANESQSECLQIVDKKFNILNRDDVKAMELAHRKAQSQNNDSLKNEINTSQILL